jgi:biopolymer transport protein ExbB/TolQ
MTELLEFLGTYWWILIILIVFVYSAFEEWLEFKTEQRKIGSSTEEMEAELQSLRHEWETERKRLNRRIQHLETIVTSEVWDRAHSDRASQESLLDDMESEDQSSQEEKAERLAQRLRNR